MTSPASGLIQTIIQLRELTDREQQQRLNERELGLRVETTREEALGNLQKVLSSTPNPKDFLQYAPMFAKRIGESEAFVKDLINKTPPSIEAMRASKTSQGAGSVDPTAVAFHELTGMSQGAAAEDAFQGKLVGAATDAIVGMDPSKLPAFRKNVLNRMALGESPEQASQNELWESLPDDQKKEGLLIAKGLLPNASEVVQQRLAAARITLDQMQRADQHTESMLHLNLMMDEASQKLSGETQRKVLSEEKAIKDLLNKKPVSDYDRTMTRTMINNHLRQLQILAPDIYGKGGSIPVGQIPIDKPWTDGLLGKALKQLPIIGGLIP